MNKLSLIAITAVLSAGGAFGLNAAFSSAHGGGGVRHHGLHRAPVHAEYVVPARDNTFKTITFDRGTITGVDGSTVHLREGTKDATYKTIDVTLGSDAVLWVNGQRGSASDLKAGQKARITHRPNRTLVVAFTTFTRR